MNTFLVRTTSGGKKLPLLTCTHKVTAANKAKAAAAAIKAHRAKVAANVNIVVTDTELMQPNVGETFAAFQQRTMASV